MVIFKYTSMLCCFLFAKTNALNETFTLEGNRNKIVVPPLSEETDVNGLIRYPCYVNVRVFTSPDMSHGANNVPVYAITFEKYGTNESDILGYTKTSTDGFGNACVRSLCYKDAYIQVKNDYEKLVSSETQHIRYGMKYERHQTSVRLFDVQYYGSFLGTNGPVYTPDKFENCLSAPITFYHFTFFALSGVEDDLIENENAAETNLEESWYPYREGEFGHQNCFMKIKVQTSIYSMNITTRSINEQSGFWYGTFITGPKMDPNGDDQTNRAACIEVRCPHVHDFEYRDIPTKVEGVMGVPFTASCTIRSTSDELRHLNATDLGFTLTLEPNNYYGQSEGIYTAASKNLARSRCFTGHNYPPNDYDMNPDTGFAISYDCF